jgi:predicted 3-demethylubiquinone-9 3-methyltransferase (glyoxalase superfamily)
MPLSKLKITTCLWFDGQAEEAASFYTSIFPNSKVVHIQHQPNNNNKKAAATGQDEPPTVLLAAFDLDGHHFVGLNGGPLFKFNEAVSFQIDCANQEEVDYYWDKLGEGGDPAKQVCGWLGDRFGVSWQVVPTVLKDMLASGDRAAAARVNEAMRGMKKLDIEGLEKAFGG